MRWVTLVVSIIAMCSSVATTRTWTDSTGKHSIEAEFVDFQDGKVRLKKGNGDVLSLPIERLSEDDQEYVRKQKPPAEPSPSAGSVTHSQKQQTDAIDDPNSAPSAPTKAKAAQTGGKPNGVPKEPMPKTVRHLMSLVRQEQVNARSGERFDVFMAGMAQFGEIYQAVLRVVEDHNGETAMSELARVIGEKQGSSKARDRLVYDNALWALSCFCDPEKDFDKDVAMVAETLRDHCNPRVAEKAIAELDKKYGKNSPGWKTGRKAHGG